jgi:hypothetical protein
MHASGALAGALLRREGQEEVDRGATGVRAAQITSQASWLGSGGKGAAGRVWYQ